MSESIVLYVQRREAFDAVLAEVFRRSELFDLGSDDAPVVAAEGHASLFIGHGCDPLSWTAEELGVSEDDLRDEFEAVLRVRDPHCLWVRYRDVPLLKRFLWLVLSRLHPVLVDNDAGFRAKGVEYIERLRADPEWNLTDP